MMQFWSLHKLWLSKLHVVCFTMRWKPSIYETVWRSVMRRLTNMWNVSSVTHTGSCKHWIELVEVSEPLNPLQSEKWSWPRNLFYEENWGHRTRTTQRSLQMNVNSEINVKVMEIYHGWSLLGCFHAYILFQFKEQWIKMSHLTLVRFAGSRRDVHANELDHNFAGRTGFHEIIALEMEHQQWVCVSWTEVCHAANKPLWGAVALRLRPPSLTGLSSVHLLWYRVFTPARTN